MEHLRNEEAGLQPEVHLMGGSLAALSVVAYSGGVELEQTRAWIIPKERMCSECEVLKYADIVGQICDLLNEDAMEPAFVAEIDAVLRCYHRYLEHLARKTE